MERSLLEGKIARLHCPTCGAQGRWRVVKTDGRVRYLLCSACGVGHVTVAVTEAEVKKALG
jgi:uncharacterized Zn finger protein